MQKRALLFVALATFILFAATGIHAQQSRFGTPASTEFQLPAAMSTVDVSPTNIDWNIIDAEDALAESQHQPVRAGFSLPINKSIESDGTWELLPDGRMMWRLKIETSSAVSVGVVFDMFHLPEGAELYIYNEDKSYVIGAFTSDNNNPSNVFSTHLVPGSSLTIEYIEQPAHGAFGNRKQSVIIDGQVVGTEASIPDDFSDYQPIGVLHISEIIYAYNDKINNSVSATKASGSCEVNINCSPEGDLWQDEKHGVARILYREGASWYYCSGSLVNNTNQNGTPYFLTAYHCGAVASTADHSVWQFYFNYEYSGCTNTGTPPNNMITGCTKRAEGNISGGTDMQLVELSSTPSAAWNVYYNGWDRSGSTTTGGVGIHHPAGDVKKISTFTGTTSSATWFDGTNTGATNGHWTFPLWATTTNGHGVSEGGSSGSSLFNMSGRVIGTLSGGSSDCAGPFTGDLYGKFSIHWQNAVNGSGNAYELKHWLDPAGTNPTTLNGMDPNANTNPPVTNFVADRVTVVAGETVNFTDLSTNVPTSWTWTFTNGFPSTSTYRNPTCVWTNPGTYTVSLTSTNAYGSDNETKTAYITVTAYTTSTTNPVVVGTGTSTAAYPLGATTRYERSAAIYTSAQIGRSGFIEKLGWYTNSATTVYRPIKVYVKHTTAATFTANTTWDSNIAGATLVYEDSLITTAATWKQLTLNQKFYYNGTNNLMVLVEQNKGVTINSNSNCRYTTAANTHQQWSGTTAPTGNGTRNGNRPNLQVTFEAYTTPVAQFTAGDGTVIMSESFDGTWLPTDWTVVNTHATNNWDQGNPSASSYSTIDAGNVNSAIVPWVAANQDEWLISPQVNTAAYAGRPLKIKFHLGFGRTYLSPGATLSFKISTNNGTTWTQLWNAIGDVTAPTGNEWAWRLLNIDLSSYAGQNLKFAWQYVGNDGDLMGLDGVKLYIDETPTQVTIYEGDHLQYTDLTTGNPMVWDWTLPGAVTTNYTDQNPNPQYNVAGIYNSTLNAGNPLGQDAEAKTNFVQVLGRAPIADFWGNGNLTTVNYQPFIPPGGLVDYFDYSSRVPTGWNWTFASGLPASNTVQNPIGIAYSSLGEFDATLRTTNAHGADTATWTNFVAVGGTKYVTNFLPWDDLAIYSMTSGYLPGHNNNAMNKYAEFFENAYPATITKVRLPIYQAIGTGKYVSFTVWDGSTGSPGTVLGTTSVEIGTLNSAAFDTITFTTPIAVTGDFFVGYEISYDATHNYTTHMFCPYMAVDRGPGEPTTAYVMYSSTWYLIDGLFGGLATAIGIEPEVTYDGAALATIIATATPGCATGSVTLTSTVSANQTFYLQTGAGGAVANWTGNTNTHTFTGLATGDYKGYTDDGGTISPTSNTVTLTNDPTSVGGTLSGPNTQICFGSNTGVMTVAAYTGAITKWQKRVSAGVWVDITNTAATYSEAPSSAGTWDYRAEVQSGSCSVAYSNNFTIVVDPTSVGGSVTPATATICLGSPTGTLTLGGNTGAVVKWQKSNNGGSTWTDIANTAITYSETPLAAGTWFYRAVVQSGSCTTANSASASITVNPVSVGGSVSGGVTEICLGTSTGTLTLTGNVGTIVKWQKSNNGGSTWTDIANTAATYSETPGTAGTWLYRAVVQSGVCSTSNSSSYSITVYPASVGGSVTGSNTEICLGSSTGTLTLSGYTGTITKWQKSNNGGSTWTDITNTAATYSETPGTAGTWLYRAVVQSGICSISNSASFSVTVDPTTVAGSVSGSSSNICLGSSTGTLTLSGHTGAIVKWQKSNNGGSTWTDIANTATTYSETPGAAGTWLYRAVVQSGLCTSLNSASYSIVVAPTSVGGSVSGTNTEICLGSATGTMTLSGYTGTITKWQKSNDGGSTWTDITNTAATWSETPGTAGTWLFRSVVQSGVCSTSNSASFSIVVDPASVGGTVNGATEICLGSSTGALTLTGYVGTITKWQKSNNGGSTWTDITNTAATYSETPATAGTWLFRAVVQSGVCSSSNSASLSITVYPTSVAGTVTGVNSDICLGSNTGAMTLAGNTGTIVKWQKSLNAGAWVDITNTVATYSETPASAGTWQFRAVIQSGVCSTVNSVAHTIVVNPLTVAGSVSGTNTEICLGSNTGTLTLSGYTGAITKWQKSNNGGSTWTDIANTAATYNETPGTAGTWIYRAVVQSGSCSSANSASFSVIVNPVSVGGTVTAGVTQIYLGDNTGSITLASNIGVIVRWEKRLDGGAWTPIASTANPYSEIPTSVGFWDYRAVVQTGTSCSEAYSNFVQIEVLNSSAGTVSGGNSPICLGSSTGTMTLSGYTGTIIQWQKSNDGGSIWTNISNTGTTYSETPGTAGTWLYRAEIFTTVTIYSAPQSIVVNPATVGGSVTGGASVCLGSSTGILTLAGNTGSVIKWQVSTDGGSTWSDIANTATTYSTTPGVVGTYLYRAVVQSGVCSIENSTATSVVVDPVTVAGSVTGGSTICAGSSTGTLTLSGHTGSIVKWQRQYNSGGWNDIANTSTTFSEVLATAGVYEYRAVVQSGACSVLNSAISTVTVEATSIGGTVNGTNSNICLGDGTGTLTLSGYTGTIIKWQKSNNGGSTWSDISNTAATYSETPVVAGVWEYRAEVMSGSCSSAFSTAFTVTVGSVSVGGTLSGTASICAGSSTGTMTLSGYAGSIIKWQRSNDGGSTWSDIVNTNATYSEVLATAGSYIYQVVVQNGSCTQAISTTVTITVDPATVAGSVSGSNNNICLGSSTGTLTLSGETGSVTKWQRRVDAGSWVDIANTNTTYSEIPASAGVWEYRAEVISGSCSSAFSAAFTVNVSALSVGGTLSGTTTICAGSSTGTLTLTGYTGSITKWQVSTDGGSTWSDIANTSDTWNETLAAAGTYIYQVVVLNGSCTQAISTTATVTVDPTTVAGSVTGPNSDICFGDATGTLSLSGNTGTIIKWQSRVDAGAWNDIPNTTSSYGEVPASAGVWEYRAEVMSGSCSSAFSAAFTVNVSALSVGGTLAGTANICEGTSTGTITLTGYTGSVIKWQVSTDGGSTWSDRANTADTWSETLATAGTYIYQAIVQSGTCGSATSATFTVTVDPTTVAGTLAASNATICEGSATGTMTLTGYTGSIVKWQKRLDGGAWTDIANTTNTYDETPASVGLWEYQAVVQSGSCTVENSNIVSTTVTTGTVAGTLSGGNDICESGSTGTITLAGYTGTINKWQYRLDGGTWTDIANTSDTWTEVLSTAGTYEYRVEVQSGSCVADYSTTVTIVVSPLTVAGSMSSMETEVCEGSSTGTVILSGFTGDIVKWQRRIDGGAWTDIANTMATYDEITTAPGLWEYRAEIQSGICTSDFSATVGINVLAMPVPSFTYVANDLVVDFTNTSTNATSYSWNFGDGTAASTLVSPSHTYATPNAYTVVLSAWNGVCTNQTNEVLDVLESVIELENGSFITMYPNPSNGEFNISLTGSNSKTLIMSIYDMNGKLIRNEDLSHMTNGSIQHVSLGFAPAGMYNIRITYGDKVINNVMIVE